MFRKSLRSRAAALLIGTVALSTFLSPPARAETPKGPCAVTKQVGVLAKMCDGVTSLPTFTGPRKREAIRLS